MKVTYFCQNLTGLTTSSSLHNIRDGIQELRFKDDKGKDFPKWKEESLKEIISFIKDGTHGTHVDTPGGSHLLLSAKNIKNGSVIYNNTDRRISESEFNSIQRNYKLQSGDILLSIVGTIGNIAVWSEDLSNIAFQRSVAFLRFKTVVPRFAYYLMYTRSFQHELRKRTVISAQPGVYLGDIVKIKVKLPTLPEQQKIANFLSAIDNLIQSKHQRITQALQWKKGLMQKMFI